MTKKKQVTGDETGKAKAQDTAENKDVATEDIKHGDKTTKSHEEKHTGKVKGEKTGADNSEKTKGYDKEASDRENVDVKLAELQDRYLRLSAEFDNYRKRTLREKIELTKNAGESILISLIPVMDDFERALSVFGLDTGAESFHYTIPE